LCAKEALYPIYVIFLILVVDEGKVATLRVVQERIAL
jgi:hypothetical protein